MLARNDFTDPDTLERNNYVHRMSIPDNLWFYKDKGFSYTSRSIFCLKKSFNLVLISRIRVPSTQNNYRVCA